MAKLQALALAPSKSLSSNIAEALRPLDCVVHEGYSGQDVGRIIRETEIGLVVFAGELPGLSAERILTAVSERVPQAMLIIALPDPAASNALASRFKGHAVPWPLRPDTIEKLLTKPKAQHYITPRREPRLRFLGGAKVMRGSATHGGVLLNVSPHGAMLVCDVDMSMNDPVSLQVPYGAKTYVLDGFVKHMGNEANLDEGISAAPWLALSQPRVLGIQLRESSVQAARELCLKLAEERQMLNLRVTCIPGVPKGLTPVLQKHGIRIESLRELPDSFEDMPPILLADVSTCTLAELDQLLTLRRKSVVIGVATTPITDKLRSQLASRLPGIFVLPFQNDSLVKHVEDFFAPVDRRFPRIEEPFTILFKRGGGTVALEGINLSLHGCGLFSKESIPAGTPIEGTLAMDQAIHPYQFKGEVVYCLATEKGYRLGVSFEIQGKGAASYQKYLSSRFLKQLRARWEEQLRSDPV